jgi:hypothetical protein
MILIRSFFMLIGGLKIIFLTQMILKMLRIDLKLKAYPPHLYLQTVMYWYFLLGIMGCNLGLNAYSRYIHTYQMMAQLPHDDIS